jgi:hypothetical protein
MTWRSCPFEVGRVYSVVKPFKSLRFEFVAGKKYAFVGDVYNRYDSMTIFNFRSDEDGKNYQWWLHDEVPLETWREYFKPE